MSPINFLDSAIAACLTPLALWLLVSGADDFLVDLICLAHWFRRRFLGRPASQFLSDEELNRTPEKRIAVFVPLWREHKVIGKMLEHNLAAAHYENFDYFVGCYPNDDLTIDAVREVEAWSDRVHVALCPHDGPTSKADCLNWIYKRMLLYEDERGVRFDIVVVHDAEDLAHPLELRLINFFCRRYDMVQVPVLPLPTPLGKLTHGFYCDEFAEFQSRDVPARGFFRSFIPSNGVGTGYSRRALERLAATGRIFEPACLTEDYVNGLRLHRLGCSQLFVPIHFRDGAPVATRAYFPMDFRAAVRQRTRWVVGIALQSWERFGWSGGPAQIYWFWRDRKGLVGNPLALLVNGIFVCGFATWLWSLHTGTPWRFGALVHLHWWLQATLAFQLLRIGVRTGCVARIYGWPFALGAPLRALWGNWINCLATLLAIRTYLAARLHPRPLPWLKTEHVYPQRSTLAGHKPRLGELLAESGLAAESDIRAALATKPAGRRLGEHLVKLGRLSEADLYTTLSLQHNVPFERLDPREIPAPVARALPAAFVRKWRVVPYKVVSGNLFLAGPELPAEAMYGELRRLTRLEIRYRLVTPRNFEELKRRFIEPRGAAPPARRTGLWVPGTRASIRRGAVPGAL